MSSIQINQNQSHLHIHIPFKYVKILFAVIILFLVGVGGYLGYRFYIINYYNPIANEKRDISTPEPPPDVKKTIQRIELQAKLNQGTKQSLFLATTSAKISPIPIASISALIRVPILMYHYVEYVQNKKDTMRIALNTTPWTLEEEIKTMISAHYTFITNNDLADVLDGKTNLPPNPVLLTFDDGYNDFYTNAYSILRKYNVKATAYIIPGLLDHPNFMSTSQLKEIAKDESVEIASHTIHHVWLKGLALQQSSPEIFQSKLMLEQIINKPVTTFAYPYGAFDDNAIRIVKEAGYRLATSTQPGAYQGQANRFFLFRLRPGGKTGQHLLNWLTQKTY